MFTLFSELIKLISLFINDRATKLEKDKKTKEFYLKAFNFLKVCYSSWSLNFKAPIKEEPIVRDFINNFDKELKENEHYFYLIDKIRFRFCVRIARKHALLWSKPNSLKSKINVFRINCCKKTILKKMKRLAKKLGMLEEYNKFPK